MLRGTESCGPVQSGRDRGGGQEEEDHQEPDAEVEPREANGRQGDTNSGGILQGLAEQGEGEGV